MRFVYLTVTDCDIVCLLYAVNLQAYQPELMRRYCQLSVSMETDAAVAQHELRQVRSSSLSCTLTLLIHCVFGSTWRTFFTNTGKK